MIDDLINALISREGGYVNNPNDSGGETNMGITALQARAHGYVGPMTALPRNVAVTIYKSMYWAAPHFDTIAINMPKLAAELFDAGVNMGPQKASMFLQRALNVLNRGGADYPDIAVDGQLGKISLYALAQLAAKRSAAEVVLIRLVEAQKAMRYIEIAEANPSQEAFEYGWILNRVGDIS